MTGVMRSCVPLHHVQAILGHENLSQTSTYLNATRIGLQESMRRLDDSRVNPVAKTSEVEDPPVCNTDELPEANLLVN